MTKNLKISADNAAALDAAIFAVAGKKKAFVHTASDVIRAAARAEDRIEVLGMPKTHRPGATVVCVLEGPARSYRYAAYGTHVHMTRKAGGWVIDEIRIDRVYPGSSARLDVTITEDQQSAAMAARMRDLKISITPAALIAA